MTYAVSVTVPIDGTNNIHWKSKDYFSSGILFKLRLTKQTTALTSSFQAYHSLLNNVSHPVKILSSYHLSLCLQSSNKESLLINLVGLEIYGLENFSGLEMHVAALFLLNVGFRIPRSPYNFNLW